MYNSEVQAGQRYLAFADVAMQEGRANIAHMFKAIAASEHVHAKNFSRILKTLGVQVGEVDLSNIRASTTQQNLKYASQVELSEIDSEYPEYIARISPEKHQMALEYINYGWDAEKQHRDMIKQIESGTGMFFSVLLKRFRNNPKQYFVNQNCGATVSKLPDTSCPICHMALDTYLKIAKP